MPKESEIIIGFTMGDPNGIGPEVLVRALHYLHPFNEWEPLIFGDLEIIKEINKAVGAPFLYKPIPNNHNLPIEEVNDSFCIPVVDLTVRKNIFNLPERKPKDLKDSVIPIEFSSPILPALIFLSPM